MSSEIARIGILTVSDRASRGEYEDRGGPAIAAWLAEVLCSDWKACPRMVSDDLDAITGELVTLCSDCSLVITTGGTGPAPRDVTPEATEAICRCMLPGFGEWMRSVSRASVPTAILSRQTAGLRGKALIVNCPGRPSSIRVSLLAVFPAIPYCLDLIGAARIETDPAVVQAFRPT